MGPPVTPSRATSRTYRGSIYRKDATVGGHGNVPGEESRRGDLGHGVAGLLRVPEIPIGPGEGVEAMHGRFLCDADTPAAYERTEAPFRWSLFYRQNDAVIKAFRSPWGQSEHSLIREREQ